MEKAYDLKELGEEIKKMGLPLAEDMVEKVAHALFNWLEKSAVVSKSTVDDLIAMMYPSIKAKVFEAVDKIDGEEG
jgi:hypothetical protein